MLKQLEAAAESKLHGRAVVQLVAVLGVIRVLRTMAQRPECLGQHLELIDKDDEWLLFRDAVLFMLWGSKATTYQAIAERDGDFPELSHAIGLLAWLAWDLGVDIEATSKQATQRARQDREMSETREELEDSEQDRWFETQLFALLAPKLAGDSEALDILKEAAARTPKRRVDVDLWFQRHVRLVDSIARCIDSAENRSTSNRTAQPGQLVRLGDKCDPQVRLIYKVAEGSGGTTVYVYDFDKQQDVGKRLFLASKVACMKWM